MTRLENFMTTQDSAQDIKGIPGGVSINYDQQVFKEIVNFVTNIDPKQLTRDQNERLADIIIKFDMVPTGEETEVEPTTEMIKKYGDKMKKFYAKHKDVFDTLTNKEAK